MEKRFPFNYFKPTYCSGLLDDPLLLINIRPSNGSILIDCGQLTHLAKRVLNTIHTIFISHAHMDHFMGIDKFTRTVLTSKKTIQLFGPPGIAAKLEKKMGGYDWNLVEDFFCSYKVCEIHHHQIEEFTLSGAKGFRLKHQHSVPWTSQIIYENSFFQVEAAICDHKIPVLVFKLTEKPYFQIDEEKIEKNSFRKGSWLTQLKKWFHQTTKQEIFLDVPIANSSTGQDYQTIDAKILYQRIEKEQFPPSIGYITDIGLTESNTRKVLSLMKNVTLLYCECTYLKEQVKKARKSYHLCTDDLNELLRHIKPEFFMPIHLSKAYLQQSEKLYQQLKMPRKCILLKLPERTTPQPMLPDQLPEWP